MKINKSKKNFWKKVWNNRKIELGNQNSVLTKLMILNGHFDSKEKIKTSNWKKYGRNISLKLGIKKNESIFEFGCGGGALLFLFRSKTKKLFGCDYSQQLINKSKKIIPWLKIYNSESQKFKSKQLYDYVISSSMLEYVQPNQVRKIINNMVCLFNKSLFIGEILDMKYRKTFLKKYKKPDKYYTFIDKSFFRTYCKKNKLNLKIYPSILPRSSQKKFRYCVQIYKLSKKT